MAVTWLLGQSADRVYVLTRLPHPGLRLGYIRSLSLDFGLFRSLNGIPDLGGSTNQHNSNSAQASVKAYVIGLNNSPRSVKLLDEIRSKRIEVDYVRATNTKGSVYPYPGLNVDIEALSHLLHYRPSGGEVGCSLSHLRTYQLAFLDKSDWALVLEDDAFLTEYFDLALAHVKETVSSQPTVISLYSECRTRIYPWSRKKLHSKNLCANTGSFVVPPCGTVGYFINRAALRIANKNQVVSGLADWPVWMWSFRFVGFYPWAIGHETMHGSSIGDSRQQAGRTPNSTGPPSLATRLTAGYFFDRASIRIGQRLSGGILRYLRYVAVPALLNARLGRLFPSLEKNPAKSC